MILRNNYVASNSFFDLAPQNLSDNIKLISIFQLVSGIDLTITIYLSKFYAPVFSIPTPKSV